MFLDYFALTVLIFVVMVLFYGIIAIHDIPYEIATHRNHPQQDTLQVAGWGQPFHPACHLALPLHLGDPVPPGPRLGLSDAPSNPAPRRWQSSRRSLQPSQSA
jgi:hypothetical protein